MTGSGIPEDVRQFIFAYIDSVEQMEVLLLLRACDGQWFTAKNVSEAMRTSLNSARNRLNTLHGQGFLESDPTGESFHYKPVPADQDVMIGKLADEYRIRKHKILELIFSPMKRAARNFADAFMVNKPKKDEDDNG